MNEKSGIPLGSLWGLVIIAIYVYAFTGFGVYFVWKTPMPFTVSEWLLLMGSSIGYLIMGIICFIPTFVVSLYFVIRDRNIIRTLRRHWPIFAAIGYMVFNPIPGPLDDLIVDIIMGSLEIYLFVRRKVFLREYLDDQSEARKKIEC